MNADDLRVTVDVSALRVALREILPCDDAIAALQTLMATHGHTLTVEQRAAVRGWMGRVG
jgi:hypothetical protein